MHVGLTMSMQNNWKPDALGFFKGYRNKEEGYPQVYHVNSNWHRLPSGGISAQSSLYQLQSTALHPNAVSHSSKKLHKHTWEYMASAGSIQRRPPSNEIGALELWNKKKEGKKAAPISRCVNALFSSCSFSKEYFIPDSCFFCALHGLKGRKWFLAISKGQLIGSVIPWQAVTGSMSYEAFLRGGHLHAVLVGLSKVFSGACYSIFKEVC